VNKGRWRGRDIIILGRFICRRWHEIQSVVTDLARKSGNGRTRRIWHAQADISSRVDVGYSRDVQVVHVRDTWYVIRAYTRTPVCGGENTIEKSRHRHSGGLDRTVSRLQGYPASRVDDQQKLFYTEDHQRLILSDVYCIFLKKRSKRIEFLVIYKFQ